MILEKITISIEKLSHYDPAVPLPSYQTLLSAGADVRAQFANREAFRIRPGERVLIPTGFKMAIPKGFEVQVRPRSGLSLKTGLMVVNGPGTIDADYRGEVFILLGNLGETDEWIQHGDRIAQLVVAPIIQGEFVVTENKLPDTARGTGGFGSTGVN